MDEGGFASAVRYWRGGVSCVALCVIVNVRASGVGTVCH